jgi:hypothetical protein
LISAGDGNVPAFLSESPDLVEALDFKLVGFTDKELAEYLREFNRDLENGQADAEESADTIRCCWPSMPARRSLGAGGSLV